MESHAHLPQARGADARPTRGASLARRDPLGRRQTAMSRTAHCPPHADVSSLCAPRQQSKGESMSTGSPDGAVQAPSTFSRGGFVARALAAAGALSGLTAAFERAGLASAAAAGSDLTLDTLNGLAAFVVPGRDDYSSAQGQSTA